MANEPVIIGRQSSHYTRVVRMFADEVRVACRFTPVGDLMSRDPEMFAGNPALKLPILRADGETIFGSVNICRALYGRSSNRVRVFWPWDSDDVLLMNAHEILAHAMTAEVDVVIHEIVEQRPPDNASRKRRESLIGCLEWLDRHLDDVLAAMPGFDLSLFGIQFYCLVSHLPFRNPVDLSAMPRLRSFADRYGRRESAVATPYRFDQQPPGAR